MITKDDNNKGTIAMMYSTKVSYLFLTIGFSFIPVACSAMDALPLVSFAKPVSISDDSDEDPRFAQRAQNRRNGDDAVLLDVLTSSADRSSVKPAFVGGLEWDEDLDDGEEEVRQDEGASQQELLKDYFRPALKKIGTMSRAGYETITDGKQLGEFVDSKFVAGVGAAVLMSAAVYLITSANKKKQLKSKVELMEVSAPTDFRHRSAEQLVEMHKIKQELDKTKQDLENERNDSQTVRAQEELVKMQENEDRLRAQQDEQTKLKAYNESVMRLQEQEIARLRLQLENSNNELNEAKQTVADLMGGLN